MLLGAAKRLEPLDLALARETYLEALWAAVRAGRFGKRGGLVEAAQAAGAAPAPAQPARAIDLLLDGLAVRFTHGYAAAAPMLTRALAAFRHEGLRGNDIGWCWLACHVAMDLWDDEACAQLVDDLTQTARDTGALNALPFALNYLGAHQIFAGDFSAADQLIHEADAITAATRNARIADFSVLLAAWRGDRARTFELRDASIADATVRGEGFVFEVAQWAAAVLHNGLGEYHHALIAAQRVLEQDDLGFAVWVLPELIEAAARSGEPDIAAGALKRLTERTGLSTSDWAGGIDARSQALLTDGQFAEDLYLEAIDRLGRSRVTRPPRPRPPHLRRMATSRESPRRRARTVAHGLPHVPRDGCPSVRRAYPPRASGHRREDAQTHRRNVRRSLVPGSADRATRPQRPHQSRDRGSTLHQPPTVEYHLRKVFTKLDINSANSSAAHSPPRPGRQPGTLRARRTPPGETIRTQQFQEGDRETDRPKPPGSNRRSPSCRSSPSSWSRPRLRKSNSTNP